MKFFKYCYFVAAIWVLAFSYLQLSVLPGIRHCVLEKGGVSSLTSFTFVINALKNCGNTTLLAATALLAVTSVIIVIFGFRKGYFVRLYNYLEKKNMEWIIVAVVTILATLPYLSKGNVLLGDALLFSPSTIYMKEAIMSLTYPFLTFYWYMGSELFAFYGWLYFLASGITNIFVGIDWTNKILFFTFHFVSALLTYKFVKIVTKNSKVAIIAALVYALSFEHIARIMIGRSVSSMTYLLIPLIFLFFEMRIHKKLSIGKTIALISVTMSLLFFNQPIDAFFIISIFLVYSTLRAFEIGNVKKIAYELIIILILAAALISFWIVPMILERGEVNGTGKVVDVFMPHVPDMVLMKEMVLWPGKWGSKPIYYVGLSVLTLSSFGLLYLSKRRKFAIPITTLTVMILLLIQTPRYAPVMLLMLGISSGYGFAYFNEKIKDSKRLLFIVAIILIIDMVPATLQLGYPDFSYTNEFYKSIEAKAGERVLDLSTDRRTFWPALLYANNPGSIETVFGLSIETAPNSFAYSAAISNKLAHEIYDLGKEPSEESLDGLYILGVKSIIIHPEQKNKNPRTVFQEKRGAIGLERNLTIIELSEHGILLASSNIEKTGLGRYLGEKAGWYLRPDFEERTINWQETDKIIKKMKINRKDGVAEKILVKDGNDDSTGTGEVSLFIKGVKTRLNKVEVNYELSDEAYIQSAYSYYTSLSVKINGQEVSYYKTAINTIAFKSKAGEHILTIEAKQSELRKIMAYISIAALAIVSILLLKKRKQAFVEANL